MIYWHQRSALSMLLVPLNLFAKTDNVDDYLRCEKRPLEALIHTNMSNLRRIRCPLLSRTTCLGWMSTTFVSAPSRSPMLTMCVLFPAMETWIIVFGVYARHGGLLCRAADTVQSGEVVSNRADETG